jgi:hypothetical protein
MLVFIDESGDPGFDIARGATPVFVVAMVIFSSNEDAAETQTVIAGSEARRIHKPEFKFNKCSDHVRDLFFEAVRLCPFVVRAILVRKELIYSSGLSSEKEKFYEYFVGQMMRRDNGLLNDARVIIDGSGDREFRRNLNAAMRRKLGQGAIKDVRFKDSRSDVLVQLADMCAGAIARSHRPDRKNPWRWRNMLLPRIDDVWEFG